MVLTAPFDLQYWFINVFSGSWMIFISIALLLILMLAAKFKMNTNILLIILTLFSSMMLPWYPWLAVLMLLGGIVIIWITTKIVRQ